VSEIDKQKLTLWRNMVEDHYQYMGGTGATLEWPYDAVDELVDEVDRLHTENEKLLAMVQAIADMDGCDGYCRAVTEAKTFWANYEKEN